MFGWMRIMMGQHKKGGKANGKRRWRWGGIWSYVSRRKKNSLTRDGGTPETIFAFSKRRWYHDSLPSYMHMGGQEGYEIFFLEGKKVIFQNHHIWVIVTPWSREEREGRGVGDLICQTCTKMGMQMHPTPNLSHSQSMPFLIRLQHVCCQQSKSLSCTCVKRSFPWGM